MKPLICRAGKCDQMTGKDVKHFVRSGVKTGKELIKGAIFLKMALFEPGMF